jgi:uncharacterized protein (TIGR00251 family)
VPLVAKQARGRAPARRGSKDVDFVAGSGEHFVVLRLHVRPGASAEGIVGTDAWRKALVVQVRARAEKGEANRAVAEVLAAALGVPVRDVVIERGATSREKTVRVVGVKAAHVRSVVGATL